MSKKSTYSQETSQSLKSTNYLPTLVLPMSPPYSSDTFPTHLGVLLYLRFFSKLDCWLLIKIGQKNMGIEIQHKGSVALL